MAYNLANFSLNSLAQLSGIPASDYATGQNANGISRQLQSDRITSALGNSFPIMPISNRGGIRYRDSYTKIGDLGDIGLEMAVSRRAKNLYNSIAQTRIRDELAKKRKEKAIAFYQDYSKALEQAKYQLGIEQQASINVADAMKVANNNVVYNAAKGEIGLALENIKVMGALNILGKSLPKGRKNIFKDVGGFDYVPKAYEANLLSNMNVQAPAGGNAAGP